jgi:hypothetical protein
LAFGKVARDRLFMRDFQDVQQRNDSLILLCLLLIGNDSRSLRRNFNDFARIASNGSGDKRGSLNRRPVTRGRRFTIGNRGISD